MYATSFMLFCSHGVSGKLLNQWAKAPASSLPFNCSFQQGIVLCKVSSVVRIRQHLSIIYWCLAESFHEHWSWKQKYQIKISIFCHSQCKKWKSTQKLPRFLKTSPVPAAHFSTRYQVWDQDKLCWPDLAKEKEDFSFCFSSSKPAPCS